MARHVSKGVEPYFIGWQSSYMQLATKDMVFVRNKKNQIDVLDSISLKVGATLETGGHGVFCTL